MLFRSVTLSSSYPSDSGEGEIERQTETETERDREGRRESKEHREKQTDTLRQTVRQEGEHVTHWMDQVSVSLFLPCKPVHLYHFSRFHIYALIYDICFSLSDLLHSVGQSLGPSTSLQMTQFRSFLWLSNIPLYICTTSSLSIRLLMDI